MSAIAVLGPGGVGGFVAGALARRGTDVVVAARESTASVISESGLDVRSVVLGEFVARPRATAFLSEPVDVLIVATKAVGLDGALDRVASGSPGVVVPLLNGLEHMAALRERFGSGRVAAGTIRVEADRPAPGRIVQTSPSVRVELAADEPALHAPLARLCSLLSDAGIPALTGTSEQQILWSKLVRLTALACTTSASFQPIGVIRSDPEWRAAMIGCVSEAVAVAAACGATIDPAVPLAELDSAHPELSSSMQRDIAAGREPELDAIAGAVLRAGRRAGIDCPTIAKLGAQIAERAGLAWAPA